jgi:hypothetical protein
MTDLVPVIYALRSSLNEARPLPEQAEVVMDCMLRLERLYSAFDDLEIVVAAKQLLAEHLVNDGKEFTVKNHVQGKGFEPIKRALVHAHVPDSLSVAEMLTYQFKPSASKKQYLHRQERIMSAWFLPCFSALRWASPVLVRAWTLLRVLCDTY